MRVMDTKNRTVNRWSMGCRELVWVGMLAGIFAGAACRPHTRGGEVSEIDRWNRLADSELKLSAKTGDLEHLARAWEAVRFSIALRSPEHNRGALTMRAAVEMASHRFAEARDDSEHLRALMPGITYPLLGLGDALFQLGEYAEAERLWREIAAQEGDGMATEPRLAQIDMVHGRMDEARKRMQHALELAQAAGPEYVPAVVSCRVRLGEMAFRSGDWETAETQYSAARALQPDDYAVLEHLAELRGAEASIAPSGEAQKKVTEAIALYTQLIESSHRPELMQALGDLYNFMKDAEHARTWRDRAEAAYLASVQRGEAGAFHHLAGFYCDSSEQPEKALDFAQRDLLLRKSIQAYDALAWALCKAGKLPRANEAMTQALMTGTRDAHILYHAGMIRMSSGDIAGGGENLRNALAVNPRYQSFHVHRP
jgi:tetratricopeptide (TPR) repeat protein